MNSKRASTLVVVALATATTSATIGSQQEGRQGRRVTPVGATSWEILPTEVQDATRAGLAYLARTQSKAGFWTADVGFKVNANYRVTKDDVAHIGITGLAIMAFLAWDGF